MNPLDMIWVRDTRPVEALIGRLPYEERSLWRAKKLGGTEHFGWGTDRMIWAVIANAANTKVKGKPLRKSERIEAPRIVERGEKPIKVGGRRMLERMIPPSLRH